MKSCHFVSFNSLFLAGLLLISCLANGDNGYDPNAPGSKDVRNFTTNTIVKVYLNYSSFEAHDFPDSFTQEAFERAIKTAIDKWVQLSGFRLRVEYRGVDNNKQDAGDREVLIIARKSHPEFLASAHVYDYLPNKGVINIFREYTNRHRHNWTVFPSEDLVGCSILRALLHEMGHVFGLHHNIQPHPHLNTVMHPVPQPVDHHGPYHEDIEDLVEMYGRRNPLVLKVKRSTDNGRSWSDISSNINTRIGDTTLPIVVNLDSDRMVAFHTSHDKKPAWNIGNTSATNWNVGKVFGGENSFYGTTGHGYDNEYMMTWVDHTKENKIKIVRSNNGGETWHWRNPPADTAIGTPSVHKVANNIWVLAYPAGDVGNLLNSGRVLTRVSTNDGASWGPAVELFSGEEYRALGGVSVSSDGTSQIRIAFAHLTDKTYKGQIRSGSIITITARVDGDRLRPDNSAFNTGIITLNGPILTKSYNKFYMGYKGVNDELIVRTTNSNSRWWSDKAVVSYDHIVNPTVAANKYSTFSYFFYHED